MSQILAHFFLKKYCLSNEFNLLSLLDVGYQLIMIIFNNRKKIFFFLFKFSDSKI